MNSLLSERYESFRLHKSVEAIIFLAMREGFLLEIEVSVCRHCVGDVMEMCYYS